MGIEKIRQAVREGRINTRYHASRRMLEREILYEEVLEVILKGEVIKTYPEAKPFPAYLIMGFVKEKEPLYVLCSFDGEMVHIITVHWLDPKKWITPWARRKRK
ncbi:MAG: hypothetical protein AMJ89_02080 [candidate division Zixibacteria bacterium SM23_73]|nr:MAG: hypothetical protein AMJ89_02080 [candidate division Zixibacteria bacterium SM23_73]